MVSSFPPATDLLCTASALVANASENFGEMKSRQDEEYVSLIPTGQKLPCAASALATNASG
jgi:hypothetical protein